jgi:hypothetical protein
MSDDELLNQTLPQQDASFPAPPCFDSAAPKLGFSRKWRRPSPSYSHQSTGSGKSPE